VACEQQEENKEATRLITSKSMSDVAGEWAQWRGPNRDGRSTETGLVRSWPEDGPTILWRKDIGPGFSAVSVKEGRAYLMSASESDEYLYCLDVKTGDEVWTARLNAYYRESNGDGPRSTPIIDSGVVYAMGSYGMLYAFNAISGEEIWQVNIHGESSEQDLDHDRGHSSSPLIEGDLLILSGGPQPNKTIIAYDKKTGKIVWTYGRDKGSYCSPVVREIYGKQHVLTGLSSGFAGLDSETGEELWFYEWETNYGLNIATPLFFSPNYVLISSGYGMGSVMLELVEEDDKWTAQRVWSNNRFENHFNSSVSQDGYIYGFDSSILKCINARTGEEAWKTRGYGKGSLILADGMLIVLGEKGNVGLIEATPTAYTNLANAQVLEGRCWTMPTLANGRLFLRNASQLVCVELAVAKETNNNASF
jgi:outer membrane protein assembly factor BamB